MISVPQICRTRLEDVTNFPNTILLSTVVQVYEKKVLNHHKQESSKKGCGGKFRERQLSRTQNSVKHLRWSFL